MTATAEQVITIAEDTTAPEFANVQANETLTCGTTPAFTEPTVADNCTGHEVTVESVVEEIIVPCGVEYVKTWTATDPCGNVSTAETKITVADAVAPEFNLDPEDYTCLLYTSPSPRDQRGARMPSSA